MTYTALLASVLAAVVLALLDFTAAAVAVLGVSMLWQYRDR